MIILASSSPRRKELLNLAGYTFTVFTPEVDESVRPRENPKRYVARLAREKALAAFKKYQAAPGSKKARFLLAADTTVVSPAPYSVILGKPESRAEAVKMLAMLSGRTHTVFTGVCVLRLTKGRVRRIIVKTVATQVTMRKLSRSQILKYLALGESWDKAGAYGAQGSGMALISKIKGSYTNVIGLPVAEVVELLS